MVYCICRIVLLGWFLFFGTATSKVVADDTLESLKLELSLIGSQIEDLRSNLLSPEVRSLTPADAGIALLRLDALEAKLRAAVGRVEAVEFHLEILSKDAAHRISEFNNKLMELEITSSGSDLRPLTEIGKTQREEQQPENSSDETLAFDKALISFNSKDFGSALENFISFNKLYPKSINAPEVYYWLGLTNVELKDFKSAASAFLESFSRAPVGSFAWKSLLGLAVALGDLGQKEQGCLTLQELRSRFPDRVSLNLDEVMIAEEQLKCLQ